MLDNLGLGEFFFLALLALLFFGPERLPAIGARIGGWVRNLTQYSSTFLNEWREEALAVHEAAEQVKGIRDEIIAAQAEITGTLEIARSDASDAISGARHDVRQQIQRSTQVLPDDTTPPSTAARSPAELDASSPAELDASSPAELDASSPAELDAGEDVAIAKTQAILDNLLAQDGPHKPTTPEDAPATPTAPTRHTEQPPTPPARPPHVSPTDVARLRDQVAALRVEMDELRQEVAQFRASTQSRTRGKTPTGEQEAAATERSLEASPQSVPTGEPA